MEPKPTGNKKKAVIIAILLLSLVLAVAAAALIIFKNDDEDSTELKKIYRYDLAVIQPFDLRGNIQVGTEIVAGVRIAEENPEKMPNTVELVLQYDKESLELVSMTTESGLLSLNNNIDNNSGKATIDIATTNEGYNRGELIVQFQFKVKKTNTDTYIKLDEASTFGSPNQLDYKNSINNLSITLSDEKPQQEN